MNPEDTNTQTTRALLLSLAAQGALAAARMPRALVEQQHKMTRAVTEAGTEVAIAQAAAEFRGCALGMYLAGAIDQPMLAKCWEAADTERDGGIARLRAMARKARGVAA